MKAIPRSGWISHGISLQDVESVADHSFSVCVLSLLLADLEAKRGGRISVERVLRLAVLHDMSESLTFDISKAYLDYLGDKGEAIKNQLEEAAWKHLVQGLNDPGLAQAYTGLQAEYAKNKTVESRIVHAADALDVLLQVIDYRRKGYPDSLLADLWSETSRRLSRSDLPSVSKVHALLVNERKRLRSQRSPK